MEIRFQKAENRVSKVFRQQKVDPVGVFANPLSDIRGLDAFDQEASYPTLGLSAPVVCYRFLVFAPGPLTPTRLAHTIYPLSLGLS